MLSSIEILILSIIQGFSEFIPVSSAAHLFLISKYSSLSSIIASLAIPGYILIFQNSNLIFFTIMFVLIFYTHKGNVKRLKNKEESKTKIY